MCASQGAGHQLICGSNPCLFSVSTKLAIPNSYGRVDGWQIAMVGKPHICTTDCKKKHLVSCSGLSKILLAVVVKDGGVLSLLSLGLRGRWSLSCNYIAMNALEGLV